MTTDLVEVAVLPSVDRLEKGFLLESPQTGPLLKLLLRLIGHDYSLYIQQLRAREAEVCLLEAKYGVWEATLAKRESDFATLTAQVEAELAEKSAALAREATQLEYRSREVEAHIDELRVVILRLEGGITESRAALAHTQQEVARTREHLERLGHTEESTSVRITERQQELASLEAACTTARESASRLTETERLNASGEKRLSDLVTRIAEKHTELQQLSRERDGLQTVVTTLRAHHLDALDAEKARSELARAVRECTEMLQGLRQAVQSSSLGKTLREVTGLIGNSNDGEFHPSLFGQLKALIDALHKVQDSIGTAKSWTLAQRIESVQQSIRSLSRY